MLIELLTDKYPGMRFWLTQRLTALVMAGYLVVLLLLILLQQPANHDEWVLFFAPVWWRIITLLFFICLYMHAWLGVRDVLRDYIFNTNLRGYLQMGVDILLVIYCIWASIILWNI